MTMPHDIQADSLIRIEEQSGVAIWRTICPDHLSGTYVLARTPIVCEQVVGEQEVTISASSVRNLQLTVRRVPFDDMPSMIGLGLFVPVECKFRGAVTQSLPGLSVAAQASARLRIAVMSAFLDPERLMTNFRTSDNFGLLVREAYTKAQHLRAETREPNGKFHDLPVNESISRPIIYQWLKCLITYGFRASSLHPRFDERGGSGTGGRIYGHGTGRRKPGRRSEANRLGKASFAQTGQSEEEQVRIIALARSQIGIGGSYRKAYDSVLATQYSHRIRGPNGEVALTLRPAGQYPSFDQFRYLVKTRISSLDRFARRTTMPHFTRNHRGLHGCSRDGVLGPGHVYAIDSTVADAYLRSGFDRTLLVGRPVVYWVVDVWSTAIVGFYVCLAAPSWDRAKCALFCTIADRDLLSRLFGFTFPNVLHPAPTLMARLLCDRGEYLSEGASRTAQEVGYSVEYNPSYRPDLRGTGERFHRIAKDAQFGFVPGAFDARRKELDLRPDKSTATLTLYEYYAYLAYLAAEYNVTADREHLFTAELAASCVDMTPAGLWAWGHEVGLGYRKAIGQDELVRSFLRQAPLKQLENGIHFERMRYLPADGDAELACRARCFGRFDVPGYALPAVAGHVFADLPDTNSVTLLEHAPLQVVGEYDSFFDYADAEAQRLVNKVTGRHAIDQSRVNYREKMREIVDSASEKTQSVGGEKSRLSVRDARQQEMAPQSATTVSDECAAQTTVEEEPQGRIGALIGKMVGSP
ncbi:MAG: hypothetical protein PF501_15840 [Salinisphaera sp.]|jgi:putative transposase|nr:hypothetical protein [Salinisphaera sp.]